MRHALAAEGPPLNQLRVASAGVFAGPGQPATDLSDKVLKKTNLNLQKHRSQPLSENLLQESLFIFGMTQSHIDTIAAAFPEASKKLFRFREFLPEDQGREIPDPFGGDLATYKACRDSMIEAIPSLIAFLRKNTTAAE